MEWLIKDKNYLAALINMLSVDQIMLYKQWKMGKDDKSILDLVDRFENYEVNPTIERLEKAIFPGFDVNFEEIWL